MATLAVRNCTRQHKKLVWLGALAVNVGDFEAIAVAQAVIQTNQANLEKAETAVEYTRTNNQRTANLGGQGILSRDQADQTQSALDQASAAVRAAEAQLNQSLGQLNQTRAQYGLHQDSQRGPAFYARPGPQPTAAAL